MYRESIIPYSGRLIALANTREAVSKPGSDRWQVERFRILQRQCSLIAANVQAGASINREIARAARRWNGRPFKNSPGRTIKFSPATLRRIYFAWAKSGDVALQLGYRGPSSKVPARLVQQFIKVYLEAQTVTRAEAIRVMQLGKGGNYSVSAFYRSLPRAMRRKLGALHRTRMTAWKLENQIRKGLKS